MRHLIKVKTSKFGNLNILQIDLDVNANTIRVTEMYLCILYFLSLQSTFEEFHHLISSI